MAERRVGTITSWADIASGLSTFTLKSHPGTSFPDYKAGQYIALTRENCKLTAKVKDPDGHIHYEPALAEDGTPKIGPVTHSYSIASAPYETKEGGQLDIYITLEKLPNGRLGRFTESLFNTPSHVGDTLGYVDRIVGNFTLDHRASGAGHVVMVGTGTGLAPFVGMMKQAAHEARSLGGGNEPERASLPSGHSSPHDGTPWPMREGAKAGQSSPVRYTLIHANRTARELGYDAVLRKLNAETIPGFDFQYIRSVSRPTAADANDPHLCQGRANNLLRSMLGLQTREQEVVEEVRVAGGDVSAAQPAADKSTKPRLASTLDGAVLNARMPGGRTTVLTCGNADGMEDIKRICEKARFKFEMEEW